MNPSHDRGPVDQVATDAPTGAPGAAATGGPADETAADAAERVGQPGPARLVEPGAASPDGPLVREAAPLTPRAITLAVATVLTSMLLAAASVIPLPYAVTSPGPTKDTLGEQDGHPLIQVTGEETFEPTGELLLTTVAVAGGPDYPVGLLMVLNGWAHSEDAVAPVELVFRPTETRTDIDERNQAAMISSQENATVAALEELGYVVPTVLEVAEAMEDSGAFGVVEPGDVVTAVDGEGVVSFSQLSRRLDAVEPGDVVTLGVRRAGQEVELDVTTTRGEDGAALLGILIDPEFDLPVDVTIQIENIGGPSAGMMFALGVVDLLTEDDEANGLTIAGTGTMDLDGEVGPIGGIRQKLAGAARDGATWFLAPERNCDEVVGHVPDGLSVVSVSTLAEARAAVEAIGAGDGGSLPTCS